MKNFISLLVFVWLMAVSKNATAQAGTLDTTFSNDGIVTTDYGSLNDFATGIAVQTDGKIVIVGQEQISGSNHQFMVGRYLVNGIIDSTFGTNGQTFTNFGNSFDGATAVAIQSDGKIVAAGYVAPAYSFAVARYTSDGILDTTFNSTGKVTTTMGGVGATAIAIQSNGKIVVAGSSGLNFGLVRYNTNGIMDTTFGVNGKVTTPFTGYGCAFGVALQPDGKIVAGGTITNIGTGDDFAIARYDSSGILDTTFNASGKFVVDIREDNADEARAMDLQLDGKILLAGYSLNTNQDFAIIRVNPVGTLDTTFGISGIQTFNINNTDNYLTCMALQPNGKILMSGINYYNATSTDEILLIRIDANGILDNTFGNAGKVITHINYLYDEAYGIALQSDGKILLTGTAQFSSDVNVAVLRYNNDVQLGLIDFSISDSPLLVYPNPVKSELHVCYTLTENESITINLFDINGKIVQNFMINELQPKGDHKESFPFDNSISVGAYILSITNKNAIQELQIKLIVE